MRCSDILKELYGRHVRIGFKKGTNFFYCNLVTDKTVEEIDREQQKYREYSKKSLDNAVSDYDSFVLKGYDGYSLLIKKRGMKWNREETKDRYEKQLQQKKNYIDKTRERYEYVTKIHPDFILDAIVVNTFMSEDPEEPGVVIILLAGDFGGDYWNESEYLGEKYKPISKLHDEACLNLACAVLQSAVKASDKK